MQTNQDSRSTGLPRPDATDSLRNSSIHRAETAGGNLAAIAGVYPIRVTPNELYEPNSDEQGAVQKVLEGFASPNGSPTATKKEVSNG